MLVNYHTHTERCNHAVGKEREYVECAIQGGLKTLGFSDHAPYIFPNTDYRSYYRMTEDKIHEYVETVRSLAKEYARDIRILCGFELEYYPDFHAQEMEFLKSVNPDYLILGQHYLNNELDHVVSRTLSGKGLLKAYVSQVLEGLKTGDFLYLAHPDLAGFQFPDEEIEREYTRLCEGAKDMKIPLEINLLGIREKKHYPNARFFEIAAKVGNEIILGIDAHEPEVLCDKNAEKIALEMVKALNLKLITTPIL